MRRSSSRNHKIIRADRFAAVMARRSGGGYGRFARYYDLIYHGPVDYEGDVDFLERVFRRFRTAPKTILDLGCGTGNHALPMARRGYRVTGIDQSREMLALARKKAASSRARPRFVHADMRSFLLGRKFDAAVCMFGAFGYVLPERDASRSIGRIWKSSGSTSHGTTRGRVGSPWNSVSSFSRGVA